MPPQLHLSVALDAVDDPSAAHWAQLVGLAEQGALDFVTVGESRTPPPDDSADRLDAVAVLTRVAPLTNRIGLVPTVTTTHAEPFHTTTTALAGLDDVSEGRVGWLVDVSSSEAGAAGATEVSVQSPSTFPYPPQGRPPVAVALDVHDSDGQWELAASHADVVLLDADQPSTAWLAREALLRHVAEAGRDPEALRVLVRVAVDLGGGTGPGALPPAELRFTGAAADLAGLLADWHAATGVDGFHLLPTSAPADLPALVHDLVPALRERRLFRADYTGRTLRDHLGLPRPAADHYARDTETAR
ncbi:LLM class flavin-dependent oxidoreductase [Streptomyces sp. 4N124]|uniref:LLM class flavin-dependent oxidoreductase n=1 Tax=Streptomyces sp. 4N124 TaxID=3457420 RepID=UPI003FD5E922